MVDLNRPKTESVNLKMIYIDYSIGIHKGKKE